MSRTLAAAAAPSVIGGRAMTSIAATSPYDHEPGETDTEQRRGRRLGYGGREFCDNDLAVTNPKIGDQDLVYAASKEPPPPPGSVIPKPPPWTKVPPPPL
jgi:hypothetical protein